MPGLRHLLWGDGGRRLRLRHRRWEGGPAITAAPWDGDWRRQQRRDARGSHAERWAYAFSWRWWKRLASFLRVRFLRKWVSRPRSLTPWSLPPCSLPGLGLVLLRLRLGGTGGGPPPLGGGAGVPPGFKKPRQSREKIPAKTATAKRRTQTLPSAESWHP